MKNSNIKRKIQNVDDANAFAAHIEKLENEIQAEEIYDDGDVDWRVRRFGDVGSDSCFHRVCDLRPKSPPPDGESLGLN